MIQIISRQWANHLVALQIKLTSSNLLIKSRQLLVDSLWDYLIKYINQEESPCLKEEIIFRNMGYWVLFLK